jgi:hypothetical protein
VSQSEVNLLFQIGVEGISRADPCDPIFGTAVRLEEAADPDWRLPISECRVVDTEVTPGRPMRLAELWIKSRQLFVFDFLPRTASTCASSVSSIYAGRRALGSLGQTFKRFLDAGLIL